jgi:hypothetical protein
MAPISCFSWIRYRSPQPGLYPRVRPAPDAPLAGRLLPLWRPFDAVRSDFSSAVAAVVLDSYCEPPVDSDHTGVGGGASRGL